VATVYPRLATELLGERGLQVELVHVTGSVEVAPRLGLADAIVDLVSSGSTLRTNGLRSLGSLFSSEAVLVARREGDGRARELATVLRSVVQARETRYLMLNAPESALGEITSLVRIRLSERAPARIRAWSPFTRSCPPPTSGGFCRSSRRPGARRSSSSPSSGCSPEMSDVASILEDVRLRGDAAVREWALRLDGVEPERAEPSKRLPEEAVLALADSVRTWHEAQRPRDVKLEVRPGVELERRWLSLATVGIYVPRDWCRRS
jgi:hypothetical protein